MSVQTPPNMEAKDKGINNLEALVFMSRATPRTIGKKIATAAVLFMNAETTPTVSIMVIKASQKFRLPSRSEFFQ